MYWRKTSGQSDNRVLVLASRTDAGLRLTTTPLLLMRRFLLSALLALPLLATATTGPSTQAHREAVQLTCYLTDALHLGQLQALAVRQATEHALGAHDAARVARCEQALQQLLTPAQFDGFRRLETHQPIAGLLQADGVVQR